MSEAAIQTIPPRWFAFVGEPTGILLPGAQTGGAYALLQGTKSPGSSTPIHRHAVESETVYMLGGQLTLQTDAGAFTLEPGEAATLPRAGVHRLVNTAAEDARYLLLCAPANFEAFVEAVSPPLTGPDAPAEAPTPQDIQRLVAVAPAFGIEILPPTSLPPATEAPQLAKPQGVAEVIDVLGLRLEVLGADPAASESDDDIVVVRSVFAPGQNIPLHTHHESESFHVLEGEIELYNSLAGAHAWTRITAGQAQTVAGDAPHALRNASSSPALVLAISTRRIVRFFRDVEAALKTGAPEEAGARLAGIAEEYGYHLMTPDENRAIGVGAPEAGRI